MSTDNTGSTILDLNRRLTPHRLEQLEQAEFNLKREQWCDKAEALVEECKEREAIQDESGEHRWSSE